MVERWWVLYEQAGALVAGSASDSGEEVGQAVPKPIRLGNHASIQWQLQKVTEASKIHQNLTFFSLSGY